MAAGTVTSGKVEIEFTSGVWTDVSADVIWASGPGITWGRSNPFVSIQAGLMNLSLYNQAGAYTPDNPLSTYFPNVVEGKRIRYSVVRSATTYWRFRGYITSWIASDLNVGSERVDIIATDGLGRMGQQLLRSEWVEAWADRATGETCDCWPLDDSATAVTPLNAVGFGEMTIFESETGTGSYSLGSMDQGFLLSGQITLTAEPSTASSPCVGIDLGRTVNGGVIAFAVKTGQQCTATSGDFVLAEGFDWNGVPLWSVRLVWNAGGWTDISVYDEVNAVYTQWIVDVGGDTSWRFMSVYDTGSASVWGWNSTGFLTFTPRTNKTLFLAFGGYLPRYGTDGAQTNCPGMSVAGIAAAATSTSDLSDHAEAWVTTTATTRLTEIVTRSCGLTLTTSGSIAPNVTRTDSAGRSALDCLAQVVDTIAGNAYHDYATDAIVAVLPNASRPTTVALTVDVSGDVDGSSPLTLTRDMSSTPTRVTVSCADGSVTVVNTALETGPPAVKREDTFASCCQDTTQATILAGYRLRRQTTARFATIPLDLVVAAADLYAAAFAFRPGFRVRLTGLPSSLIGSTYQDGYAVGWSEAWSHQQVKVTLDCVPADAPPEGVWDGTDAGRWAAGDGMLTATGGTALGTTGVGTLILTTAGGGVTLSTSAGDYPVDLNLNGERVTVTSAPGSSTSPQTVTLTARGVAPTVARTHVSGEPVDAWHAATWAML